jgi:hypothetical protein
VNFTATGTYHPLLTNEAPSSAINSGTVLDSYLFHFDMFFTGVNARALGTVTFDSNILGIIGTHNTLVSTDSWLGIPTTLYETTTPMFGGRGLEGADFSTAASRDWSAISADRRTLTLDLGVGEWFDDVRVLVASNPSAVPSPASLPLIVIGLSILLFVRQSTSS